MKFIETPLKGAYTIELEKHLDERGFFARVFCMNEFEEMGLDNTVRQINNSESISGKTMRGIHYQLAPDAESKIIRCIRGSLFDVIVDLRPGSATFLKWFGKELNALDRTMMYVPKGFGHGFLTLEDNTEAMYFSTAFYSPTSERGLRWDDPAVNIDWPFSPGFISDKDRSHPDFNLKYHCNA